VQTGSDALVRNLIQTAQQLRRAGRDDDAARAWHQVLAAAPDNPHALFNLGQIALFRKDARSACDLLTRAARADPRSPVIALNLAHACKALGDGPGEMAALTDALTIDPYFLPALLAKGMAQERAGAARAAAQTYKNALTVAPSDDTLAPDLLEPIRHARDVVRDNAGALDAHLRGALEEVRARHGGAPLGRFEQCKDVLLGAKKVYAQQPSMLHFPGLPAIQFYDSAEFAWLKRLEAATDAIREELKLVMRDGEADFEPYVDHPDGAPIEQWAELNHSPRWSVFFLWKDGVRLDQHCGRCPATAALLDTLPMLQIPGFGPTVLFSVLAPHTRIPPHSSVTNARLVVHLPLIVPSGCRFRVGNETRDWRTGQAWVFDDTIEHEAWNDSGEVRVILMIDIWNPHLSEAERELVSALLNGMRDYYR
jgi:aspartyl/asparaginyl beta-hydroxylase (cupin superfamily)